MQQENSGDIHFLNDRPTIELETAIAICGTARRLADILGVKERIIFFWRKRHGGLLPPDRYEQLYGLQELKRFKSRAGKVPNLSAGKL